MRRWNAWIVALGLLGHATCGSAGENLITTSGWVRFQISFGRVAAVPRSHRLREDACRSDPLSSTSQEHSVRAENGAAQVHYLLESPDERLQIDWLPEGRFELAHQRGEDYSLRLVQMPGQPLRLSVVVQGERTEIQADDLWSMVLEHPAVCEQHLAPQLKRLRPDLRLADQRGRLVDELLRVAQEDRPCRTAVGELVEQLGSKRFRERQRAEQSLKRKGPGVLRYLDELEPRHLDAEQTCRIERVRRHFHGPAPDCCERIAAWLAPLPSTWLSLLDDTDPALREQAFAALCNTCDEPSLHFNPNAAPDAREAQIATLEQQLRR